MKKHTFMFLFLSVWTRSDTNLASQSFVKHVDDEFYQTEAMMFSVRHFSSRCTAAQGVDVSIVSLQKRTIYRSEKSHNLIGIIALPPSSPIQIEGLIWFRSLSPANSRSRWISSHSNKVDPWSVNTFEVPITSYSSNKTDISVHDVPNLPPCLVILAAKSSSTSWIKEHHKVSEVEELIEQTLMTTVMCSQHLLFVTTVSQISALTKDVLTMQT